jgi:hypothetical protein
MTGVEQQKSNVLRLAKAWLRETDEYEIVHVPLKLLQAIEELMSAEKLAKTRKHPKTSDDKVYVSPTQRRKRAKKRKFRAQICLHDFAVKGCPGCKLKKNKARGSR